MSRIIEGTELSSLAPVIEAARLEAMKSTCAKDNRGVAVFRHNKVISTASNGPLSAFACEPAKCDAVCGLYAMHAERKAIIYALETRQDLNGSSVLHVRIDKDCNIAVSGDLRCDDCTGFMMRALRKGISIEEFILLQAGGWTAYQIPEADRITRANLKLD